MRPKINLSEVVQRYRIGLWALLLLLTAALLLFPVHLRYEYSPIQSIHVFGDKLPLFALLYCVWIVILLSLLFSKGKNGEWQRLGLVCVFALIFFGFWAINTPYGSNWDELWNMGHVKYLQDTGRIAFDHQVFTYFQFPAIHLVTLSLCEVCGLGTFTTRIIYIVFGGTLLAGLLFVLFLKLLKSSRLAALAVILIMQGSLIAKFQVFWPGNLAFLLLVALLILLARHNSAMRAATPTILLIFILLAAFTITYLPTPLYFISILFGICMLQVMARKSVVNPSILSLFTTMFLAWLSYIALFFLGGVAAFGETFVTGLTNPMERFALVSGAATGYVGGSVPRWASLTRYFWLALVVGIGSLIGIWNLRRARKLDSTEVLETGGLLGVIFLSLIIYLAIPQAQWARSMALAPLFTIPLIVRRLSSPTSRNGLPGNNALVKDQKESSELNGFSKSTRGYSRWLRKHAFALAASACLVLSLPTFLIHETSYTTLAVYPYDCSAGQYLESAYKSRDGVDIFSSGSAFGYSYYVPEARFHTTGAPELMVPAEQYWPQTNQLLDDFEAWGDRNAIFLLSERFRRPTNHPAAIDVTDPRWMAFVDALEQHNKTYDSQYISFYGS